MKYLSLLIPGSDGKQIPIDGIQGMPKGGDNVLQTLIQFGVTALFGLAGIVALFFIIYAGISWITSGGEKEKIEEARKKLTYAVIGLIVVLASFFIINTVGNLFGINILGVPNPSSNLQGTCRGQICPR